MDENTSTVLYTGCAATEWKHYGVKNIKGSPCCLGSFSVCVAAICEPNGQWTKFQYAYRRFSVEKFSLTSAGESN